MNSLFIKRDIYYQILYYCLSQKPLEACGLLSGSNYMINTLWPIENIDKSPVSFTMNEAETKKALDKIKEKNEKLYAVFHSHPTAPPYPSAYDIEHFNYPMSYVIVSLNYVRPRLKSYKISNRTVHKEKIYLVDF